MKVAMNLEEEIARKRAALAVPAVYNRGIDYSLPTGDYTPRPGMYAPMGVPMLEAPGMSAQPVQTMAQPPVGAPSIDLSGIQSQLDAARQGMYSESAPAPVKPRPLTDSERYIPLVAGALALLGGADPNVVSGAARNVYGGFQDSHERDAALESQRLLNEYQASQGRKGASVQGLQERLATERGRESAATEQAGKERLLQLEGEQKTALQKQKDEAAKAKFEREMAALPEKERAKYEAVRSFALSNGRTQEEATSFALSKHFEDIASGNLKNTQAEDIVATREGRLNKLQAEYAKLNAGARLDDAQADLYVKRYENYDEEQAIKLALLSTQIQSLGLTVKDKQDKPAGDEYGRLKDDFGRAERDLKFYTDMRKGTSALDDVVGGATLTEEAKARMRKDRAEADKGIADAKAEIKRIESEMGSLRKRLSAPLSGPVGKRPASMEGYVPVDPMKADPSLKGKIKALTVQDVIDLL